MPDILATVSDPGANSYLTLEAADSLMDSFPNGDKWENLDESKRQRFLLQATRLVDRFKNWPPKQVVAPTEQALAFPTQKDKPGVLPAQVTNAIAETLDYFASGKMVSLKKLQAEGVKSSSVLGQNASFEVDYSELPAGARNELLKLWKIYSAPVVTVTPVERMFQTDPQTGSLFDSDQRNRPSDTGSLEPL